MKSITGELYVTISSSDASAGQSQSLTPDVSSARRASIGALEDSYIPTENRVMTSDTIPTRLVYQYQLTIRLP